MDQGFLIRTVEIPEWFTIPEVPEHVTNSSNVHAKEIVPDASVPDPIFNAHHFANASVMTLLILK